MMRSIGTVLLSLATGGGALIAAEQSSPGLSWEDHVEIQALYATYTHSLDSGDAETWADTFTPDGVLLMVAPGDTEGAGLRIAGRDALAGFATGAHAANGGHMRNWQSQAMITATPGGAEGRCYLMLFRTVDGPARSRPRAYSPIVWSGPRPAGGSLIGRSVGTGRPGASIGTCRMSCSNPGRSIEPNVEARLAPAVRPVAGWLAMITSAPKLVATSSVIQGCRRPGASRADACSTCPGAAFVTATGPLLEAMEN